MRASVRVLMRVAWVSFLTFCLCSVALPESIKGESKPSLMVDNESLLCGADSSLWHYYLWKTVAADDVQDPKQRSLVLAYQKHHWQPFFFDSRFQMSKEAVSFLGKLQHLQDEAIDPGPYHLEKLEKLRINVRCINPDPHLVLIVPVKSGLNQESVSPPSTDPGEQTIEISAATKPPQFAPGEQLDQKNRDLFYSASEIDVELMNKLIRYAKDMNPFAQAEIERMMSGEITIAEFLPKVDSISWRYTAIRQALGKYQHLVSNHRFRILDLPKLQLGSRGLSVKQLQERLSEEGYYQAKVNGDFDSLTKQAVQRFQSAHLLNPDGVVGTQTKNRLNESYEQKLKLITYSLKMLRESQTRRYDRYVRINIPQFNLEYWKEDQINGTYRVIVGKAGGKKVKLQGKMIGINQTPTLVSAIQQVILNPRWYVTDRIRLELDDELRADPNYFAKNGYVKMSSSYPWGAPRVFQMPGPNNPLGRVKFEFPNPYAVFLHDTPKRQLFERMPRDFSHGCIRLDNALNFAELLLTEDENPKAEKIQKYLDSNHQVFFPLRQPVPIIIEYIPVSSDGKDQVIFCGDPYGWLGDDQKAKS